MNKLSKSNCPCSNNLANTDDDCDIQSESDSLSCSNMCSTHQMNCDCGFDIDSGSYFPSNPMLAQSYVPIQKMKKIFNPETGLKMGTIFPELVSPYYPGQSIQDFEYIRNTNTIGEGCNR